MNVRFRGIAEAVQVTEFGRILLKNSVRAPLGRIFDNNSSLKRSHLIHSYASAPSVIRLLLGETLPGVFQQNWARSSHFQLR